MRIVGISGSLRRASANSGLLRVARELSPPDVEFVIADISRLPLLNQDLEKPSPPKEVVEVKDVVATADAIFLAVPDKPFAMGSCAGGAGGAHAQLAVRNAAVFANMHAMNKPPLSFKLFDGSVSWDLETGDITDEKARERIRAQVVALVAFAEEFHKP
ncbi:hypothetical protein NDN08_007165 [Rhodosorus marinus]|uniref:NADPH-dependent FMN reductase-like domain-containing protein n=1 Tax=Rhodosorus marinus TaxID=101924 RepID=A0AAV8UJ65_9RHOD|nr:hypothetical protein NDN08_007165 [Rhodosorus marinus]